MSALLYADRAHKNRPVKDEDESRRKGMPDNSVINVVATDSTPWGESDELASAVPMGDEEKDLVGVTETT